VRRMLRSVTLPVYRLYRRKRRISCRPDPVLCSKMSLNTPKMSSRDHLVLLSREPASDPSRNLFGLSRQQLSEVVTTFRQPAYRTDQLLKAMFQQRVGHLNQVLTFPVALRRELGEAGWEIRRPAIVRTFRSTDGTERYLVETADGQTVETVWMPGGDGAEDSEQRATICVSSQIGCAVNCQFCLTAKLGLKRNLTAGEIAGQVISVLEQNDVQVGRDRINLVFMGMGEPFLNYDAFMDAVRLLVEETGLAESRMTVSTSGIVPGILRFAKESIRPRLAISLNAPDDAIREDIMPITRKWKIEEVLEAAAQVPLGPRERVTFEYVLLGGVNDQLTHADQLIALARRAGMPVKVNLIAWNPGPGVGYAMPQPEQVAAFQQRLIAAGVPAFLRRPRGRDIYAACGQLKQTVEG
jgi:23S rRNA (adenine2503-C2)-methyltransferase